jgi:hypothetical protein
MAWLPKLRFGNMRWEEHHPRSCLGQAGTSFETGLLVFEACQKHWRPCTCCRVMVPDDLLIGSGAPHEPHGTPLLEKCSMAKSL